MLDIKFNFRLVHYSTDYYYTAYHAALGTHAHACYMALFSDYHNPMSCVPIKFIIHVIKKHAIWCFGAKSFVSIQQPNNE